MTIDIIDRLRLDPGQRTLGQLLQDREAALHELLRLRKRLGPETPEARQPKSTAEHSPQVPRFPDPVPARPAGTLLRRKEVSELLGMSHSTLYKRVAEGSFPAQVRIGPRAVRWRYEDVLAWRNAQRP
jgi:prophage regulatory protein